MLIYVDAGQLYGTNDQGVPEPIGTPQTPVKLSTFLAWLGWGSDQPAPPSDAKSHPLKIARTASVNEAATTPDPIIRSTD